MESLPSEYEDLFERKSFASFATVMPDGTPQVTPVWIDYDGTHFIVNTAEGRQKERNVRRQPKVGFAVMDPDNPYRYVSVWGEVEELRKEGAVDHIDELAQRYMGVDEYPYKDQDEGDRVKLMIRPERVIAQSQ